MLIMPMVNPYKNKQGRLSTKCIDFGKQIQGFPFFYKTWLFS